MRTPDPSSVLLPGPWVHRYVPANGCRFHIAEAGAGPLVVLLHGAPLFWWTWRRQIEPLAAAGYRVVALDLRGYGASDRPPRGYDTPTLAADVASVIRSLGESVGVVVGHGLGGWVAWAMPHLQPQEISAVAVLAAPHPSVASRHAVPLALRAGGLPAVSTTTYRLYGSRLAHGSPDVRRTLRRWGSAPGWPSAEVADRYTQAMALPFSTRSGAEAHRWIARAPLRSRGRAFLAAVCRPVGLDVLQIHGADDRLIPASVARRSRDHVDGRYSSCLVAGAGHFPQDEAPEAVTTALLQWLHHLR